jgi:hypothetical protein
VLQKVLQRAVFGVEIVENQGITIVWPLRQDNIGYFGETAE